MSNTMQDPFAPQLAQHHPFGLGHDPVHHPSHRAPTTPTSRTSHAPTAAFMHDPIGYGGLNGQSLGYNAHVAVDKSLLLPGLGGMAGHLGQQGNLQPGYPPRPVETSSLSSDSELAPSAGKPEA